MFAKLLSQSALILVANWMMVRLLLGRGGVDVAGQYFYVLSFLAPAFMLVGANFKNYASQTTYGAVSSLLGTRVLAIAIAFLVAAVGMVLIGPQIVLLAFLMKALEFVLDTIQAVELRRGRVWVCAVGSVVAVLAVSALWAFYPHASAFTFTPLLLTVGVLALLLTASLLGLAWTLPDRPVLAFDLGLMGRLVSEVGLPAFIVSLGASVPRIAVETFDGAAALGVFGSFLYVYLAAHVITIAMFQAGFPRGLPDAPGPSALMHFVRVQTARLTLVGLLGLVASVSAPLWIVTVLYGDALAPHHAYLPVFAGFVVIGSYATMLEQVFIAIGQNRVVKRNAWITLMAAMLLCVPLTWALGIEGAVAYMYALAVIRVVVLVLALRDYLESRDQARSRA
jgi:O-antigen/teichoic acid export membrane protein